MISAPVHAQTLGRPPHTRPAESATPARGGRGHVVIVGAGVGGLALSRALAQRGVRHVVLERNPEPGGVIRTVRVESHLLEEGPQRTRASHTIRELVRALGVEDQLIAAPHDLPLFIYRRGALRIAPLSLSQLGKTDLLSLRARIRLLAEPFTSSARPNETVADYFIRRFGRAAYDDLLGPLFGGLYASDPREMLVRHALLPALRALGAERSLLLALLRRSFRSDVAAPCSFTNGMRTLTDAMYESVRANVRLDTSVIAIEAAGTGFRVLTDDGAVDAAQIVLTCTASEAARLLGLVAPDAAAELKKLIYNPIALVHMLSDGVTRGMGYQVSFAEDLLTRGVTFNHALFGRDRVYTAFLGGARDRAIASRADAEIAEVAAREFLQVTGRPAAALHVARAVIPAWDRSWIALDELTLPDGIHICANYESRIGIPGRIARARQLAAHIAD